MWLKTELLAYSNVLIHADIDFLKFILKLNQVDLNKGTGLDKLINDCLNYVQFEPGHELHEDDLKPLLVLSSLSDTLRTLWLNNQQFTIQLRAMNSGDYEYGKISPDKEHFFKDFEFELFSASQLSIYGINSILSQDTVGNDIKFEDIELQCKHPDIFNRNKIDKFLREFEKSLKSNNKYGIFGIGTDDFLGFCQKDEPNEDENYLSAYKEELRKSDELLDTILSDTLQYCNRVLGVYLINSHFSHSPKYGITFNRRTNSVFCLKSNEKIKISESTYRNAYKILTVFNPKPAIIKY